jgi:predicted nucleotidyltransferase
MVKIYKLKLTTLQQEIMNFLFLKAGESFNARSLANHLEVSQPAISKALPLLEKENYLLIKKDKESGRLSIELNKQNPKIMHLKRVQNLNLLYESGLPDYLEESFPGTTIILFGSFSRGDDSINSDIDIAIIGYKEKTLNLNKYEEMLAKEIRLQFYTDLKSINKNLKENIYNGILLAGGIEL